MNRKNWYLQGQQADNSPWIVPVNKDPFLIGRGKECDLILSSTAVSRCHARIILQKNDLFIEDENSRNGTHLNGSRIKAKTCLRHNDILGIGGYEFQLLHRSEEDIDQTVLESRKNNLSSFSRRYGLSEREQEVLYLLIRGKKVPEIGEKLFISPGTAKLHTQNIYKKTGCHSRIQLLTLYRGPVEIRN